MRSRIRHTPERSLGCARFRRCGVGPPSGRRALAVNARRSQFSAALLRLAGGALAPGGSIDRDPSVLERLSEGVFIAIEGVGIGVMERLCILLSPHPKVWKVVQEATEDCLAILPVCSGIKDVAVPHLIYHLAGNDVSIRIDDLQG